MSTKMDAINIELVEKHYKDWIKDNPGWPYDSSTMIHFGEFCLHKELDKYHELEEASNGAWWAQGDTHGNPASAGPPRVLQQRAPPSLAVRARTLWKCG